MHVSVCVCVGANVNAAGSMVYHPRSLLRRPLSKRLHAHSAYMLHALVSRLMIFRRHDKCNICFDEHLKPARVGSAYVVGVFDFIFLFPTAAINEMSKNYKSLRLLFIHSNKMRVGSEWRDSNGSRQCEPNMQKNNAHK